MFSLFWPLRIEVQFHNMADNFLADILSDSFVWHSCLTILAGFLSVAFVWQIGRRLRLTLCPTIWLTVLADILSEGGGQEEKEKERIRYWNLTTSSEVSAAAGEAATEHMCTWRVWQIVWACRRGILPVVFVGYVEGCWVCMLNVFCQAS